MKDSRFHFHHGVALGDDAEGGGRHDWKEEGGTDREGGREEGWVWLLIQFKERVRTTHRVRGL